MLESLQLSFHIVRRNWWVYRKDFIANISPTVADPAFLLLSLGAGLGTYMAQIEGHSYSQYLAPGLAVGTAMFTAFFETSYGFFVRLTFENIFKAMLTTPIGITEIVFGEFIWVGIKGALMISFVSLFLALFGLFHNPMLFPLVPIVGLLIALPHGAMGLLSTCWVKNINQFQTVYAFLISPIYFFSGVFFPISQMPEALQWVAAVSPLYHGVKLAQAVFWDQSVVQAFAVNGPILVLYSAALLFWAHRQVRKKLQA
jgi:lipooligosaccharide transport system permease protein